MIVTDAQPVQVGTPQAQPVTMVTVALDEVLVLCLLKLNSWPSVLSHAFLPAGTAVVHVPLRFTKCTRAVA